MQRRAEVRCGYNAPAVDRLLEVTHAAEQRHFWFRGFRRFVRPFVAEACRARPQPVRLVDCGCGTGLNLTMLADYGRAFGFDLTARGLAFARQSGLTRIARASITEIPFPDRSFDVATSFDVLYSLTDEQETAALREMHRVLVPGGAMVLNVAALKVLRGQHSVFSAELRRYDRPRLRQVVEAAGFTIKRMTYTNATLFPLIAAVRLAQRAIGSASPDAVPSDMRVPAAPVNAVLSGLLAAESQAVKLMNMPFGSSLVCLAIKR
jgi:ubiquinone/menaquinone biosynthesis C-methylase UbiE